MSEHTLLRLIHIVTGVVWTGAAVLLAAFVIPAIRAVGPGAAPVMRELMQNRKLPVMLTSVGWLTVLSGATLAWRDAGALGFRWFESGAGLGFGLGAVAALMAILIGTLINAPTAARMGALVGRLQAEGRPPSPEEAASIKRMQDTLYRATQVAATLLLIATGFMAVARSFG